MAGCASKPPATPAPKTAQAPTSARKNSQQQQKPQQPQGARSAKRKPAPGAVPDAGKPETFAKAERIFLRPVPGAVIARFDGRGNKGIDFAGRTGEPVLAAREGQVVYAGAGLRGYGRMVMIKHDARYLTAYAHNSALLVKDGDRVRKGQQIARMGDSDADRVKLHFELRRNGAAVDPVPYFASGGGDTGAGADPG